MDLSFWARGVFENIPLPASNVSSSLIESSPDSPQLTDEDDYYSEHESDAPSFPATERLEYALCAYHKALQEYETHIQSLQSKEKPSISRPTYRGFARLYNIDHTILMRRYKGETQAFEKVLEQRQRLTSAEEISIVDWILQLESWNFPPLVSRVRELAEEILRRRQDFEPLGIHWPQKFLSRHPEISSRWSQPLERDRANNATYETISHWFHLIEATIRRLEIQQEDCYNMDEKGFGMGLTGKEKVFCSKDNLHPYMKEPTNTEWVSVLECILACGGILPPYIIFKAKVMMEAWLKEIRDGGKVCMSDKGWTNNYLGLEWFKQVFHPYTQSCQKGEYRLLVLDGHASHITSEVIDFCKKEKIVLACLPSHTTHILQPLDVSFFLPLANGYRRALSQKFRLTKAVAVTKRDFMTIYQEVRDQVAKESTIRHAWQKSGLFPLNPKLVLDKIKKKEAGKAKAEETRPVTPPEVFYISSKGATVSAPIQTPGNITEVNSIINKIKLGTHSELELKKLSDATSRAFAKNTTLEITNEALLEKDEEMKKRAQYSKKQLGKGQVMGQEVLDQRRTAAQFKRDEKDYWDAWKDVVCLFKDATQEAVRTQVTTASDKRKAIAQLRQEEKEHWDIWKDVVCLFKEPKEKAVRKPKGKGARRKNMSLQTAPEPNLTTLGIENLAIEPAATNTTRFGRVSKPKKRL